MHNSQFDQNENRIIAQLDAGVSFAQRANEAAAVRMAMAAREKARLKFLLRQARITERCL